MNINEIAAQGPGPLTGCSVQNYLGIRNAEIELAPGQPWVSLYGPNHAGKTSLWTSLLTTIEGMSSANGPLLHGDAAAGFSEWRFGRLVARREVERKPDGSVTTRLKVWPNPDKIGSPVKAGQTVWDELRGLVSIDPEELLRVNEDDPKKAAGMLLKAFNLSEPLAALDAERAKIVEDRLNAGREVKQLQGAVVEFEDVATVEKEPPAVDVSALMEQRRVEDGKGSDRYALQCTASDARRAVRDIESTLGRYKDAQTALISERLALEHKLAELNERIKNSETVIADAEKKAAEVRATAEAAVKQFEQAPAPDTTAIDTQIASADKANALRRRWSDFQRVRTQLRDANTKYSTLDLKIAEIEQRRTSLFTDSAIPVKGLSVSTDGIILNARPLAQASSQEQISVCVAVAIAASPKLRLIIIKNGSLLDDASRKCIRELTEPAGYQVLEERVSNADKGLPGIIIEEGVVIANNSTTLAA